jgi:two-component system, cell cycle sensor histidine kinase and response regulator CckA
MEKSAEVLQQRINELEKERSVLLSILDAIPCYIYLIARDHSIPYTNKRFRQLFGDQEGKHCYQAISDKTEPCDICPTFQVFKTKLTKNWVWVNRKGHSYVIFDSYLPEASDPELIVEVGLNLTHLKETEQKHQ